MTMQDPMADMLTRIRNAQSVGIAEVAMPASKSKAAVAEVLKAEGYIEGWDLVKGERGMQELKIALKYWRGRPVIEEIRRISRPGLRQYRGKHEIPQVNGGLGIYILSTNKGVMTDRAARAQGIGGELICAVF